jgi:PhzF family phenazine biosynthesis protein
MGWYRFWQVDAFTNTLYDGNPAAVCLLDDAWPGDEKMQAIAAENNLSETAFLLPSEQTNAFQLRWMTPTTEVKLCGHATLAAAHAVHQHLSPGADTVHFSSRFSGELSVRLEANRYFLDFPARPCQAAKMDADALQAALGTQPTALHRSSEDWIAEFSTEAEVAALRPDFSRIASMPCRGLIATAPGSNTEEFVSRFFGPAVGVPEDPVTGSAHCALTPFWHSKTGLTQFHARQIGRRGGAMDVRLLGDRVELAGQAVTVIEGKMQLSNDADE